MKNGTVKEKVKRLLVLSGTILILSGCGAAARESGYYQHNTMYRGWDHFIFSLYGYKKADPQKAQESKDREWWGINIEEPQP
jgi:hypothetical protein